MRDLGCRSRFESDESSECDRDVDVILRDAGTRGEWLAGHTDRFLTRIGSKKEKEKSKRDDSRGILSGLLVSFYLSQLNTIKSM
jgi:hypothetical protein